MRGNLQASWPSGTEGELAIESLALRQLDHPRYNWLCDYDYMVQHHDLAPPTGFSTVAEVYAERGFVSACVKRVYFAVGRLLYTNNNFHFLPRVVYRGKRVVYLFIF